MITVNQEAVPPVRMRWPRMCRANLGHSSVLPKFSHHDLQLRCTIISCLKVYNNVSCLKQIVTNCKNTVQGFKRFHGRAFSDPYVQRIKSSLVYDIAQMPTGTTGIKVVKCLTHSNTIQSFVYFQC